MVVKIDLLGARIFAMFIDVFGMRSPTGDRAIVEAHRL